MQVGYVRNAVEEPHPEAQFRALRKARCQVVFHDCGVHLRGTRPQLGRALERLSAGDVLVVRSLDRLAGSLGDLLGTLRQIEQRGAGLRALMNGLDTRRATTAELLEAMADFERLISAERIQVGIRAAKARGQHVGRPRLLDSQQVGLAVARARAGESTPSIARALGVSPQTLRRALQVEDAIRRTSRSTA